MGSGASTELAFARFTEMILFAMAGMAIFLVSVRSTGRTGIYDDHGDS
jgi:hypothetical protein